MSVPESEYQQHQQNCAQFYNNNNNNNNNNSEGVSTASTISQSPYSNNWEPPARQCTPSYYNSIEAQRRNVNISGRKKFIKNSIFSIYL